MLALALLYFFPFLETHRGVCPLLPLSESHYKPSPPTPILNWIPQFLPNSFTFYFFMELTVFWHTYILLIYIINCLSCTMECKLHGDKVLVVLFGSFCFALFVCSVLSPAVFSAPRTTPGTLETLWTLVKQMNKCFQITYRMAACTSVNTVREASWAAQMLQELSLSVLLSGMLKCKPMEHAPSLPLPISPFSPPPQGAR